MERPLAAMPCILSEGGTCSIALNRSHRVSHARSCDVGDVQIAHIVVVLDGGSWLVRSAGRFKAKVERVMQSMSM